MHLKDTLRSLYILNPNDKTQGIFLSKFLASVRLYLIKIYTVTNAAYNMVLKPSPSFNEVSEKFRLTYKQ